MPKDNTFDVYVTMEVNPTEDRSQIVIGLDIRDAGKPWASTLLVWHDVPDESVDYITYAFQEMTGSESSLTMEGTSEKFVLQLEEKGIQMLKNLNDLGKMNQGKSRHDKDVAMKKFVREMGIEGKGKRHADKEKKK